MTAAGVGAERADDPPPLLDRRQPPPDMPHRDAAYRRELGSCTSTRVG
ncbi:hypothetical protein [Streptomyces sp. NPDC054804]